MSELVEPRETESYKFNYWKYLIPKLMNQHHITKRITKMKSVPVNLIYFSRYILKENFFHGVVLKIR